MIRTIHYYISRELVKVTLLALVAFTLVLTVIAIIEPLRKQQGLSADQVLALFGYLMPVMFSLTLPIGALFAATIVYGRFSQDNELLACRASGISTGNLLRPALVLGLVVTFISLVLNNFVAPKMVAGSKTSIEQNVKGVAYRQLRTRNYGKWGSKIVHADSTDEASDTLHGVVYAESKDTKDNTDTTFVVASTARLNFTDIDENSYLQVSMTNPRFLRTGNSTVLAEDSQDLMILLPNPVQERAAWMDWDRMLEAIYSPWRALSISRSLMKIKRDVLEDALACHVESIVRQKGRYEELERDLALPGTAMIREKYVIHASSAKSVTDDSKSGPRGYHAELTGKGEQGVKVEVFRGGKLVQTYLGPQCDIGATWSDITGNPQVNLTLRGPVLVSTPAGGPPQRRATLDVGQLPVPKSVLDSVDAVSLEDIYRNPNACTKNAAILSDIGTVVNQNTRSLQNEIKAEMHSRVAYSLSCFLLVSVGAALGLIFRGGQFISAFAIGAIPGAIVVIMIFAGKNMMENSKVNNVYGLAAIWSGIAILLLANVIVYGRLIRR